MIKLISYIIHSFIRFERTLDFRKLHMFSPFLSLSLSQIWECALYQYHLNACREAKISLLWPGPGLLPAPSQCRRIDRSVMFCFNCLHGRRQWWARYASVVTNDAGPVSKRCRSLMAQLEEIRRPPRPHLVRYTAELFPLSSLDLVVELTAQYRINTECMYMTVSETKRYTVKCPNQLALPV